MQNSILPNPNLEMEPNNTTLTIKKKVIADNFNPKIEQQQTKKDLYK